MKLTLCGIMPSCCGHSKKKILGEIEGNR